MTDIVYPELSTVIYNSSIKVLTSLGCGLPEICYRKALVIELSKRGLSVGEESVHKVFYDDVEVGFFRSDLVIDQKVILELKATDCLTRRHISQTLTYLQITGFKLGILINFGNQKLEMKRLIL